VTATCVLVKPNPYNPNKGLLTFFGDGIVPGETTIKIYTLSGELVKDLSAKTDELVWDGKTENGEPVASGIYLYTYESPKEKGVGKFTVIIK
jgi:flagellar hook assembly protein FlgD